MNPPHTYLLLPEILREVLEHVIVPDVERPEDELLLGVHVVWEHAADVGHRVAGNMTNHVILYKELGVKGWD